MKRTWITLFLLALFAGGAWAGDFLAQADSIYELRGVKFDMSTLLAGTEQIDRTIELYKQANEASTGAAKEEATWKWMRSLYFKGNYTTHDSETRKKIYDIGKAVGAEGLKEFPESVGIHLYMAIIWGVWGEEYGIFKAAKEGVANKIRMHCEKVNVLDETFDDAGGYRVYGRLHFKAPKIPLVLGWPSNDKAVEYLEKAHQLAPQNLITIQFLAEALCKNGDKERAQKLMQGILATQGIVEGIVEDTVVKSDAATILKKWEND